MSWTLVDRHDWHLDTKVLWGPIAVDLFASRITTQVFSWKPDILAEATGTFLRAGEGSRALPTLHGAS